MAAPLRLKSERVGKVTLATERPYLSVLVDTGVFHLDQPYDYSLPERYQVEPGQWVSVPFHGKNLQGLVIERKAISNVSKVLPINRVIKGAYISPAHLELFMAIAKRWAAPIFDVLRFTTKKNYSTLRTEEMEFEKREIGVRSYLQLSPEQSEALQVRKIVEGIAKKGSTLLVIPEARLLESLKSDSYQIGLRGSILSSESFVNVVVLREESEHHYELKSPGFNTRDVALLRNQYLKENLIFIGFSPSLELMRLIENGYIQFVKKTGKLNVLAKPSLMGELIPSSLLKSVRAVIGKGPLLVVAPSKGYGLAISCATCRNLAKCTFGGKLSKASKNQPPKCVICSKTYEDWKCDFCGKQQIYLLGRGVERISEELGKSFPNVDIHISTADKSITSKVSHRSIVLATAGAAPDIEYAGVLILDGMNNSSDMRSEERYLSLIMRHATLSRGNILLVDRSENPLVNALVRWNPNSYLKRLLSEYQEAKLPPSVRHALLRSDPNESDRIYSGFMAAIREGRLPKNVIIHNLDSRLISILFTHKDAEKVVSFLFELQRRRSMAGKQLLQLRIDPYLLG